MLRDEVAQALWPDGKPTRVGGGYLRIAGLAGGGCSPDRKIAMPKHVEMAEEMFCYQVRKYIGAYLAVLGGADAVVFGGGIGENAPAVRARICAGMEWCELGVNLDRNAAAIGYEARISSDDSTLHAYVTPVDEASIIGTDTLSCLRRPGRD